MRDCVLGDWDPDTGIRGTGQLDDPVEKSLAGIPGEDIHFSRLDAAIRALAPAAQADICVSQRAHDLFTVLVDTHRRALLSYDQDMDHRGTHALIAARALLTIVADGDDTPIHEQIEAYANNSTLLNNLLRAFSAAAEESPDRASTAARVWPSVVAHVIRLYATGHISVNDRRYGDYALASLLPNIAAEVAYLYRELDHGEPIAWWQPLSWQTTVEQWLPTAQGSGTCVDNLIGFLRPLAIEDQVRVGLPWVASLVLPDPGRVANHTFLLSSWLIEARQAADDLDLLADWQRVVDALVVAGVSRLAPYSE
jgi:hypothetical protein